MSRQTNGFWIPALIVGIAFSANAFADHRWDDDDDCDHRHRHGHRHRVKHVVVQHVYEEPRVVYQTPPQVIYRDRVVYRDAPAYEPRHYGPPAPAYGGNRTMGQAIGAVAGGVIGNQFGKGNGKVAATAAGAVIGSVVGGNIASYDY